MKTKVTFTVTRTVVLLTNGTDQVSFYTDKPSPFPPVVSKEPLSLTFEVSHDKGVKYCKDVFGIDAEVINTRS